MQIDVILEESVGIIREGILLYELYQINKKATETLQF